MLSEMGEIIYKMGEIFSEIGKISAEMGDIIPEMGDICLKCVLIEFNNITSETTLLL